MKRVLWLPILWAVLLLGAAMAVKQVPPPEGISVTADVRHGPNVRLQFLAGSSLLAQCTFNRADWERFCDLYRTARAHQRRQSPGHAVVGRVASVTVGWETVTPALTRPPPPPYPYPQSTHRARMASYVVLECGVWTARLDAARAARLDHDVDAVKAALPRP